MQHCFGSLVLLAISSVSCAPLILDAAVNEPLKADVGGPPASIVLSGLDSLKAGLCASILLKALDAEQLPASLGTESLIISITVSSGRGRIYADESCVDEESSFVISAANPEPQFFFRSDGIEAVELQLESSNPSVLGSSESFGVGPGVTQLSTGYSAQAAFLISSGALAGQGSNQLGQLGDGSSGNNAMLPKLLSGFGARVVQAASGSGTNSGSVAHTCVLLENGDVKCFGRNNVGQLGMGDTTNRNAPAEAPVNLGGAAQSIAVGKDFSCAVLVNGSIKCWGDGSNYQLGNGGFGTVLSPNSAVPLAQASRVSTGDSFACARLVDESVWCWGDNNYGQVGAGLAVTYDSSYCEANPEIEDCYPDVSNNGFSTPQQVAGLGDAAVELSAGAYHACARLQNGAIKCWGSNTNYAAGLPNLTTYWAADLVPLGQAAISVSAGHSHSCAVLADGTVKCWGANSVGQVNPAALSVREGPTTVPLPSAALQVAAYRDFSCALLANQQVHCWGTNYRGQLGLGTTVSTTSSEIAVEQPFLSLRLAWTSAATSISGDCSALTVSLLERGVAASLDHAVLLDLFDASSLGKYFTNDACTSEISQVQLPAESTQIEIYYKTDIAAAAPADIELRAAFEKGGANPALFATRARGPALATRIDVSNWSPNYAQCISVIVSVQDAAGQPAQSNEVERPITLEETGGGAYFSDAACTTPIGAVAIPAGSLTHTSPIYFGAPPYDDTVYLRATADGLAASSNIDLTVGCGAGGCN
jgi:alpha-tubulin suppressor-like RCC1 family protein